MEEDLEKALAALEKLLAEADCLQGVGVAELGGFPRSLLTYVKSLYDRLLRIDNDLVAADLAERDKGHEVRVAFMETRARHPAFSRPRAWRSRGALGSKSVSGTVVS